jgi:hemicentin
VCNSLIIIKFHLLQTLITLCSCSTAVGPMLITTKQDELMKELNNMTLWGGGDCPESALTGIKMALEKALPGSFVYVFTDAIAKDFKLDTEVLDLVQQKQTPITFLSTGFCNSKNSSGYAVFEKLASASNGQVYDLKKTDIAEVLESVRQMLDIKRVSLKSVDFEEGKPHSIGLEVDKSLKEFSVSVAGNKPNISFIDPMNQNYTQGKNILNLNNIQVVNVQDPIPGKWNIIAESETGGGSVRVSGISDVAFRFGFAVEQPNAIVETSYRPLAGKYLFLAINKNSINNFNFQAPTIF